MTRDIRAAGSVARAVVGLLLLSLVVVFGVSWWDVGAAVVLYPLAAMLLAVVAARFVTGLESGDSAAAAATSVAIGLLVLVGGIVLTFVTRLDGGSLYLFFGGSMLIAAVKGYGGCEVLALPNLVLGRNDRIWCWLFSPLDRAETGRARAVRSRG